MHELAKRKWEDTHLKDDQSCEASQTWEKHSESFRLNSSREIQVNEMDETEGLYQCLQ